MEIGMQQEMETGHRNFVRKLLRTPETFSQESLIKYFCL